MLAASVMAAAIAVTANFYEPDPQLEKYQLMIEKATQTEADGGEDDEDGMPSFKWRMLGWAEFFFCAAVAPSAEYRKSRSDWSPAIDNTAASFLTWGGAVGQGANMASEYLRSRQNNMAWALRASAVAACSTATVYNFNRGFFHQ